MNEIIEKQLFLGSQYSSTERLIEENGIRTVISLGCDPLSEPIETHFFDIEDNGSTENIRRFFNEVIPQAHKIMSDPNKWPVLVHCKAGMSRSAIVCITFIMKTHDIDYYSALKYVKDRRPVITPNIKFRDYILDNKYRPYDLW